MVEIASNRGKTSLSFGGQYTSSWPDGNNYPEDYVRLEKFHPYILYRSPGAQNDPGCIIHPNSAFT